MGKRTLEDILTDGMKHNGGGRESLVRLLSDVNHESGSISESDMRAIAEKTKLSPAEVESVASFYSFLSRTPRGRHCVRLCNTISCHMQDARAVLQAVEKELGIKAGETTPDGRITLETTSCLGLCDQSPAILVDETAYSKLTPEMACTIVRGLN